MAGLRRLRLFSKSLEILASPEHREQEKERICEEKGHPYPAKVERPYNPRAGDVLVRCPNCQTYYFRKPTQKESSDYDLIVRESQKKE